ncbi:hypothetical protein CAEBREN_02848 [Caenorhabditis brenneri]|uniref:Uncharacterized protein n=1 Tax=Caenorhabditis brenneri TaxID=135651 RepID=G0P1W3_CAEBE|nr:hypothetical protein CAEBREN_02848 [Caenorhabditis brenneri]
MSEDKKASSSSVGASVGGDSVRNCLQLHDKDNVYTNNSKASFDPKIVNGEDDRDDEEAYGKSVSKRYLSVFSITDSSYTPCFRNLRFSACSPILRREALCNVPNRQ